MTSWLTRGRDGARRPDLEAQAAQGQAAVQIYEQSEHAKFGLFLQDLEREQMEALNAELARLRPGSESTAPGEPEASGELSSEVEA